MVNITEGFSLNTNVLLFWTYVIKFNMIKVIIISWTDFCKILMTFHTMNTFEANYLGDVLEFDLVLFIYLFWAEK